MKKVLIVVIIAAAVFYLDSKYRPNPDCPNGSKIHIEQGTTIDWAIIQAKGLMDVEKRELSVPTISYSCKTSFGEREGRHVEYFSNNGRRGELFQEGYFKNDRKHGKWIKFFTNGNKSSETDYKDGLPNGKDSSWWANGSVMFVKTCTMGKCVEIPQNRQPSAKVGE